MKFPNCGCVKGLLLLPSVVVFRLLLDNSQSLRNWISLIYCCLTCRPTDPVNDK